MKLERLHLTVGELADGFFDNNDGAGGWSGRLDIRPFYQRESVYDIRKKTLVVDSIRHDYPLNIMYFAKRQDGTYEVLDGQQRILSFCGYVNGDYSIEQRSFVNLLEDEQRVIKNYEPMVYTCEGTDREKLDWFERINTAGEPLTPQELRNAVYAGAWVSSAKKYFSKPSCPADGLGSGYIKGRVNRQEYLERAICWHAGSGADEAIREYMNTHCREANADDLWLYFNAVIGWVKAKFKVYRSEMKSVDWGILYNRHKDDALDADALEAQVKALMEDAEVTSKKGIYPYVLSGKTPADESLLNLRAFDNSQKRAAYERQGGVCPRCGKLFGYAEMEGDHIVPWSRGGKTDDGNCQMLCRPCNGTKSAG
jgi:hypothetical protein